jgi:hypothetical protein
LLREHRQLVQAWATRGLSEEEQQRLLDVRTTLDALDPLEAFLSERLAIADVEAAIDKEIPMTNMAPVRRPPCPVCKRPFMAGPCPECGR